MVTKEPNQTLLFIKAYLPMMTLFTLISFIYITYLNTYLIQLLNGEYESGAHSQTASAPTAFIMIHELSRQADTLVELLFSSNSSQRKGIAYTITLHFFLIMFIISTFRVIKTNPGSVPDDWNNETEKDLCDLVEAEKKILRNIRRQVRKRKQQEEEEDQKLLESSSKEEAKLVSSDDQQGFRSEGIKSDTNTELNQQAILIGGGEGEKEERKSHFQGQGGTSTRLSEGGIAEDEEEDDDDEDDSELDSEEEEEERQNSEKVHQLAVMSALKRGNKRFCGHCQKFKPERAHHCRQCGTCVLKMDHHCPWVANCVGFYNYKFFMNMIIYGDILLIMVGITYSELVKDAIFDPSVSSFKLYVVLLNYLLNWFLAAVIFAFLCFHIWLILKGKSTLEFCEKKREFKYDFGKFENFRRVFGKNMLFWLVPFFPYTEGRGVYYK